MEIELQLEIKTALSFYLDNEYSYFKSIYREGRNKEDNILVFIK